MSPANDTDAATEDRLWQQLDDTRAGMLGLREPRRHMQPMTHYSDRAARTLWFLTASDTELVREIGEGAVAEYAVQAASQDYYASIRGTLTQSEDTARLDEIWSTVAAAFFEGGREDDRVTLLEMPLRSAEIWATTASGFVFGLEIARASLGGKSEPDIGEHRVIDFVAP